MNNFQKLKEKIIKYETEWRTKIHFDSSEEETRMYIQGMIDEIHDCKDVHDLACFYINSGYSDKEAYEVLIDFLLED